MTTVDGDGLEGGVDRCPGNAERDCGPLSEEYSPWVVLHIPHDSLVVPAQVRGQFVLDDGELSAELYRMTDHQTLAIFAGRSCATAVVRAPVSRLVVDVERFESDAIEPMARRGMGAVYTSTSQGNPLRRSLSAVEREWLLATYYRPHHARLETAVNSAIDRYGCCLVIDCHSFPARALDYEMADPATPRPDVCIGTDEWHTHPALAGAFAEAFQRAGWSVALNAPFSGAIVPASRFRRDSRVAAVMVEINRRLYWRESDRACCDDFAAVAARLRRCCLAASRGFRPETMFRR